ANAQAAYGTVLSNGTAGHVTHTFRVAVAPCTSCGRSARICPHALVSLTSRVERNLPEAYLACPSGHLFLGQRDQVSTCSTCSRETDPGKAYTPRRRSEEHTSELQSQSNLVCRLLLEKKKRTSHPLHIPLSNPNSN